MPEGRLGWLRWGRSPEQQEPGVSGPALPGNDEPAGYPPSPEQGRDPDAPPNQEAEPAPPPGAEPSTQALVTAESRVPAVPEHPHLGRYAEGLRRLPVTEVKTIYSTEGTVEAAAADTRKAIEHSLERGGTLIGAIAEGGKMRYYVAGDMAGHSNVEPSSTSDAAAGSPDTAPAQTTPLWPPNAQGEQVHPDTIVAQQQNFPCWTQVEVKVDAVGQTAGRNMGRSIDEILGSQGVDYAIQVVAKKERVPNSERIAELNGQITHERVHARHDGPRTRDEQMADYAERARRLAELEVLMKEGPAHCRKEVRVTLHAGAKSPDELDRVIRAWNASAPPNCTLDRSTHPVNTPLDEGGSQMSITDMLGIIRPPDKPTNQGLARLKVPHTSPNVDPPRPGEQEADFADVIVGPGRVVGKVGLTPDDFASGIFVVGQKKSGKSHALRRVMHAADALGMRVIATDPVGRLREAMKQLSSGREIFELRPGDSSEPQPNLDPFRIRYTDAVSVVKAAEHAYDLVYGMLHDPAATGSSFPGNVRQAVHIVFENAGWDPEYGFPIPGMQQRSGTMREFWAEILRVIEKTSGDGPNQDRDTYLGWVNGRMSEALEGPLKAILGGEEGQDLPVDALKDKHILVSGANFPRWALVIYQNALGYVLQDEKRVKAAREGRPDGLVDTIEDVHVFDELGDFMPPNASGPNAGLVEAWLKWAQKCRNTGDGIVASGLSFEAVRADLTRLIDTWVIGRVIMPATRATAAGTVNAPPDLQEYMAHQPTGEFVLFNHRTTSGSVRVRVHGEAPANPDAHVIPAAAIMKSANPACGPHCQAHCCTMGEIGEATVFARRGARGNELTQIAQAGTINTLAPTEEQIAQYARQPEEPIPLPLHASTELKTYMKRMPEKLAECAIRAVASKAARERAKLLAGHSISLDRMREHIAAQLRHLLLDQRLLVSAGVELMLEPYRPQPADSPEAAEAQPHADSPIDPHRGLSENDQRALYLGDPPPRYWEKDHLATLPASWGGGWSNVGKMGEVADKHLDWGPAHQLRAGFEAYVANAKKIKQ